MTTKRKDHGTVEHPTDSNESERKDKNATTAFEAHAPGEPRTRKSTRICGASPFCPARVWIRTRSPISLARDIAAATI